MQSQAAHNDLFARAVSAMASGMSRRGPARPVLYGPSGQPLRPSASYVYKRTAAKREGSLYNWIPSRLLNSQSQAVERERIVERSIDLTNNDPQAAGVVDYFATSVVGAGLRPNPILDPDLLGLTKDETRALQIQMKNIYTLWAPWADAGQRMTSEGIQFLLQRSMIQFGEFLVLFPMLKDRSRPFSLAVQVIHPLRLKTPVDKVSKSNINDGVELGEYGEPVAYWIKKADPNNPARYMSDSSDNFLRVPAKKGHRYNAIHAFFQHDPEQVRGIPFFAPAMKYFKDLNDYLDAELVANVVTAAYALFIETGNADAWDVADQMYHHTNEETDVDQVRYEEWVPGQIMYGDTGQKPHVIKADRPGNTFPVFVKEIKKALAMSLNMPYVALFKDVEETQYAGFRSAMLDVWKVLTHRRAWLGQAFCQPVWTMLQEEGYLRGRLQVDDFYERMYELTACHFIGAPKGNIEPVKEIQADILAIKNNLKTRAQTISEQSNDWRSVFEQLEEEDNELDARGLKNEPDETPEVREEGETPQ